MRGEYADPPDQGQIPACEIELRKGDVGRADHQGQQKIAESRRNERHEEEPDHDDAVQREHMVVFVVGQKVSVRRDELKPDQRRRRAADEEECRDHESIEKRNPLVVGGEQPFAQPPALRIEITAGGDARAARLGVIDRDDGIGHRSAPRLDPSERM